MARFRIIWILFLVLCGACATTSQPVPEAWLSVPKTMAIRALAPASSGLVHHTPDAPPPRTSDGPIRLALSGGSARLVNGAKELTPPFPAIESFDLSEERGEVVFSAKRERGYDVGLVSSDGSPINWIPEDPVDEVDAQWAPRGNKVSYIVLSASGDLIRTVHIPTSFALTVDLPFARVRSLLWEPAAERFYVAWSSPDASDHVDVMKYGGEERRTIVAPSVRLDVQVDPFAPGAVVLRPQQLLYGERLPLVVWRDDDVFAWNDARGALMKNARVAMIVAKTLDERLWQTIQETSWLDMGRVFVVTDDVTPVSANATLVTPDAKLAAGRYVRREHLVSVAPAVVQSFAAGFIADQLKRTVPPNGSSR